MAGLATPNAGYVFDPTSGANLPVKRAKANVAASQTDSSVVAAVAARRIRVVFVVAMAGGTATNVTFQTNATAISPLFAAGANGGVALGVNAFGWFETSSGEALKVTTGAGSTVGILVGYVEVP